MTSRYALWRCIWCGEQLDFEACVYEQGRVYCSDCGGEVGVEKLTTPATARKAA